MPADCTAEFKAMKVPRKAGLAQEATMAMPGIMRPLMQIKNRVETISTAHIGSPAVSVMAISGKITSTAMMRNKATLPRRSVNTPTRRALSKVATPPHRYT